MKISKLNINKNSGALTLYFIALIGIISIKNIVPLSGIVLFLLLISRKDFARLAKKSIISILLFNLIVSISYVIVSIINNRTWGEYLLLINLRVFDSTFLTFYFIEKFNLFSALSFSKTLSFLTLISYSQIMLYKKSFENFQLAFESRNIQPIRKENIYGFVKSTFLYFLQTSIYASNDISLAMKSRRFNDD